MSGLLAHKDQARCHSGTSEITAFVLQVPSSSERGLRGPTVLRRPLGLYRRRVARPESISISTSKVVTSLSSRNSCGAIRGNESKLSNPSQDSTGQGSGGTDLTAIGNDIIWPFKHNHWIPSAMIEAVDRINLRLPPHFGLRRRPECFAYFLHRTEGSRITVKEPLVIAAILNGSGVQRSAKIQPSRQNRRCLGSH